jgi:hypothetical protein
MRRHRFAGAVVAAACSWMASLSPGADAQASLTMPAPGFLAGIRPEVVSGNVMRFFDGVATDSAGTTQISLTRFHDTGVYMQVDVTTIGLNGRDTGGLEDGHFYFYLLRSLSTGTVGIVASRSISYSGVFPPSGGPWLMRKLPYGHPYRAAFGGFTPVHIDAWPQPTVTFTDGEYSTAWMPLVGGTAQDWTLVDMTPWVPDNARLGHFIFETRDAGYSTAGSCYVRSYGGQPVGLLVGSSSPTTQSAFLAASLRLDSSRHLQYHCTPGSRLFIQIRGYSMTEPA